MRILIYDLANKPTQYLADALKKAGHTVDVVATDEQPTTTDDIEVIDYSIILKLCDKPNLDCFTFIQNVRRKKITSAVLLLMPDPSVDTRIKALNSGFDDCIAFPVDANELMAKIFAIVRRAGGFSRTEIVVDRLHLSLDRQTAHVDGTTIDLTAKEYKILEFLCLRRGRTITKETILNYLYGGMDEPEMKIIDVFVCKLRKKIMQATGGTSYIKTIWGRGYCLIGPNDATPYYGLAEEGAEYDPHIAA